MTRASTACGDKAAEVKKGPWTAEEDELLVKCIAEHGDGNWSSIPRKAGLQRCGKSCRLRWTNYLRPDLKRGAFSRDEEDLVVRLHREMGNRWAKIALEMPGRTDNDIKNHWNTRLKRRLRDLGVDPDSHLPLPSALPLLGPSSLLAAALGDHLRKGVPDRPASLAVASPPPSGEGSLTKRRRVEDESMLDAGFASPTSSSSRLVPPVHAPAAPLPVPRAAPRGGLPSPCSLPPSAAASLFAPAPAATPGTPIAADASPSASSASPFDSPSTHSPTSQPTTGPPAPPPLAFSTLPAHSAPGGFTEAEAKWNCLRPSRAWFLGSGFAGEGSAGCSRSARRAEGGKSEEIGGACGVMGQECEEEVVSFNAGTMAAATTATAGRGLMRNQPAGERGGIAMQSHACFEAGPSWSHASTQAALSRLTVLPCRAGRVRAGFKVPPRLVIPCPSGDTEAEVAASAAAAMGIPAGLSAVEGSNRAAATADTTMAIDGRLPSPLPMGRHGCQQPLVS
ncbi:hypothetical protein CLOM_g2093 [Closterium sp. NIES-68]|nr:hypothetical protein CLOM_g2093 [Closterium sp. NIES-68]